MERPGVWSVNGSFGSDYRKPVVANVGASYARNRYGGWGLDTGTIWTIRPSGSVNISFQPGVSRSHSIGFYVNRHIDPSATSTHGVRYLFSELVQTSIDATVRLDVAISPNLSIQWYAQPFLASGNYFGFKELAEARTFEFLQYGHDGNSTLTYDESTHLYTADPDGQDYVSPVKFSNPDFRMCSLRSNLVLRWEYLPGSTLFLVWNRNRSGYANDPTFELFDEYGFLFDDDMQNTIMLKVNYWLSR